MVSGARSITARSSPAIQKPHFGQTPASYPAHCGLRVPSAKMKLVIQQRIMKSFSLIFFKPLREFIIG